jgi:anti-sigma regulatory factor (Ser/Thr protein kinase)
MSNAVAIKLKLANELPELDRLAQWIQSWPGLEMSGNTSLAVQLCLEEAVENIIMYGAVEDESVEISVELEPVAGMLVAQIEDTGQEFDPTHAPSLVVAPSLAEAKPGSVGIHLMRTFSDEMTYRRVGDRNQLTLQFVQA